MKTIRLTRGIFALVDDVDFEELNKYNWCAIEDDATFYARRYKDGKLVKMHHENTFGKSTKNILRRSDFYKTKITT